jgi:methionyl-tRNA synthetase
MTADLTQPRPILVAVAWPYANGLSHLGHIAGCYLPADIFARYHRTAGNRVLMVSGSDAHGTPITVEADREGVDPAEIVDRYHPRFLEQWDRLGISFDLFTTTMTDNHREVVHDIFNTLRDNDLVVAKTTQQYFDTEAGRFLPDRYVEGTCPHCGYGEARGDQCENCGRTLDPEDLEAPRSRLTGATPELRDTEHFFVRLGVLENELLGWLRSREGWRKHVINWAIGFVDGGLQDWPITRDLDWGVPLPTDELGPGKRIYVWFEAFIGYLSAAKEWAQLQGTPEAWRDWWQDPAAGTYYFIGKDNIAFHAVFWPAVLIGYGDHNLPTDVPANQYVTFKGAKASKSAGIGRPVLDYLEEYEPDALRFAVASNLPEYNDTDLPEDEMVRRINDELVASWGNLVNRVITMTDRYFDATVPTPGDLDDDDERLLATIDEVLTEEAEHIERVELKAGLKAALRGAQEVNAYLNRKEPWATAKTDEERTATTLFVAVNAINGLKTAFYPYVPFSSARLHGILGQEGEVSETGWRRTDIGPGTELDPQGPLFAKVEVG